MRACVSLLAVLALLAPVAASHAQVPESQWRRYVGYRVVVIKKDGSDVIGKLVGVDDRNVLIERGESVIGVARNWVQSLVLAPGARAPTPSSAPEPAPPRDPSPPPAPSVAPTPEPPEPTRARSRPRSEAELSAVAREPETPPGPRAFSAGFIVRPTPCVRGCSGTPTTFGPEVGHRYFGFALRFASYGDALFVLPDLRAHYPVQLHPRVSIEPFFEVTPLIVKAGGTTLYQLVLRPGVRVPIRVARSVYAYVEPLSLDLGVYSSGGGGSGVVRYVFGAGAQYRF